MPAAAPQPAPAAALDVETENTEPINAPMPGTIVDVMVKAGDKVEKGQVLLLLEAMKMENEIMAPRDAVIAGVHVSKGASVNSGELMITLVK
jgi:biotin carboxyl carrier protein